MDLGLSFALLNSKQYTEISNRLRSAGFGPDESEKGNPTRQRWVINIEGKSPGKVDFLIQPAGPDSRAGGQQNLEIDFAAIITPGLHLAFKDHMMVPVGDRTIKDETATREIQVCGPGAFVISFVKLPCKEKSWLARDVRGYNTPLGGGGAMVWFLMKNSGTKCGTVKVRVP